jgi:hypothetical protein
MSATASASARPSSLAMSASTVAELRVVSGAGAKARLVGPPPGRRSGDRRTPPDQQDHRGPPWDRCQDSELRRLVGARLGRAHRQQVRSGRLCGRRRGHRRRARKGPPELGQPSPGHLSLTRSLAFLTDRQRDGTLRVSQAVRNWDAGLPDGRASRSVDATGSSWRTGCKRCRRWRPSTPRAGRRKACCRRSRRRRSRRQVRGRSRCRKCQAA